jgi:cytochrome b561
MLNNSKHAWGTVAKSFHWLVAILILGQLVLGTIAVEARVSPLKLDLFVWHKSIGVSILLLVILRAVWRLTNPAPASSAKISVWEVRLAMVGHWLLYFLMVVVPLTGWWVSDTSRIPFRLFWTVPVPDLMAPDHNLSELAADVHGVLTKLLLAVVIVHIFAALRHHFMLRNDTLLRMLPLRQDPRR